MFIAAVCPPLAHLLGYGLTRRELPVRQTTIQHIALSLLATSGIALALTKTKMVVVSTRVVVAPALMAIALYLLMAKELFQSVECKQICEAITRNVRPANPEPLMINLAKFSAHDKCLIIKTAVLQNFYVPLPKNPDFDKASDLAADVLQTLNRPRPAHFPEKDILILQTKELLGDNLDVYFEQNSWAVRIRYKAGAESKRDILWKKITHVDIGRLSLSELLDH